MNGKFCPYREQRPKTEAGLQAWDTLVRCEGQFRYMLAGDKVFAMGFDIPAALALAAALRYDVEGVADMLDACESGARAGLNKAR